MHHKSLTVVQWCRDELQIITSNLVTLTSIIYFSIFRIPGKSNFHGLVSNCFLIFDKMANKVYFRNAATTARDRSA